MTWTTINDSDVINMLVGCKGVDEIKERLDEILPDSYSKVEQLI